ncbi:MAG: M23 family metallopeptidase [Myxococcales bacterium]|nr:M23 family metallopeptidase [Myxococcales bacterium]
MLRKVFRICVGPWLPFVVALSHFNCESADSNNDWGQDESPSLWSVEAPVTCDPNPTRFPVNGPHNVGFDSSNAKTLVYACPPHPAGSGDNSDFLAYDHHGNDVFAALGTPLVAMVDGTIYNKGDGGSKSGLRVTIKDNCGWLYFYAHMDMIEPAILNGSKTTVKAGDKLGTVGKTGNAQFTSPHLHLSIYHTDYNNPNYHKDPIQYLSKLDGTSCNCKAHCVGTLIYGDDCGVGDCGYFGATCIDKGGKVECGPYPCTPHCEGTVIVDGNCGKGDCGAFGATCQMIGGKPECVLPGCTPHCEGTWIVDAKCGKGDCGAFGATCQMKNGVPECVSVGCTPHCEGNLIVDAECGKGDCATFGATCQMVNGKPECVLVGCTPHCEGTVIVDDKCGKGDCGAFGATCEMVNGKPECALPGCKPHCEGTWIVDGKCEKGNCAAFGAVCWDGGGGPECMLPKCTPGCSGSKIVAPDCSEGDCSVFGAYCSTLGGKPHCVSAFCVSSPNEAPKAKEVCLPDGKHYLCDNSGGLTEAPCPAGQKCNACGKCGLEPVEVCDLQDNDCDGSVDEGVKNACGKCGPEPVEVCDYKDNDCDGSIDEGVKNACGQCGTVPNEVCDYQDNDCDGGTDEGVLNPCGLCGEVPTEVCDLRDNDCDGQIDEELLNTCGYCGPVPSESCDGVDNDCDGDIDEDFGLGAPCTTGLGACAQEGHVECALGDQFDGPTKCSATEMVCDDGDACTLDSCDPNQGCVVDWICDDANPGDSDADDVVDADSGGANNDSDEQQSADVSKVPLDTVNVDLGWENSDLGIGGDAYAGIDVSWVPKGPDATDDTSNGANNGSVKDGGCSAMGNTFPRLWIWMLVFVFWLRSKSLARRQVS